MSTDGQILGWAPTVNEINHLLDIFDEIYHASMLYHGVAPASTMAYKSNKIKFIEKHFSILIKLVLSIFNDLNFPFIQYPSVYPIKVLFNCLPFFIL